MKVKDTTVVHIAEKCNVKNYKVCATNVHERRGTFGETDVPTEYQEELYDTGELSPHSLRKHTQFVVPNSGGDEFIAPIGDTTPASASQQRISAVNVGSASHDRPENDNNYNNTWSNFQMSKSEENLLIELVDETVDLIDHAVQESIIMIFLIQIDLV